MRVGLPTRGRGPLLLCRWRREVLTATLLVVVAATGCGDDDGAVPSDAGGRLDAASADGGTVTDANDGTDASGAARDADVPADGGAPGVDSGAPAVDAGPPRDPSELCMRSCDRIATCAGTAVSAACVTGCTTDAADCENPQQDALTACLAEACETYIACIAAVGCIMSAGP